MRDGSGQEFSGNGARKLGTIEVPEDSTLAWTNDGGTLNIISEDGGIFVSSDAPNGETAVPAGTYSNVEVLTIDTVTGPSVSRPERPSAASKNGPATFSKQNRDKGGAR
jgi:hypothetical protein